MTSKEEQGQHIADEHDDGDAHHHKLSPDIEAMRAKWIIEQNALRSRVKTDKDFLSFDPDTLEGLHVIGGMSVATLCLWLYR